MGRSPTSVWTSRCATTTPRITSTSASSERCSACPRTRRRTSLELVDAAHKAGIPVIYTRFVYRADYQDGGVLVQDLLPALADTKSLAAGTWDSELVDELVPEEADFVLDKNRYSAFYGTGLEPILSSLGIDSLVMCGVTTNMCVETSARDASQRDYRVFVVSDATGELAKDRHDMALATLGFGFGWVVERDEVIAAWSN